MDIYLILSELYNIDINKNNIDNHIKDGTIKFKTIDVDGFKVRVPKGVKFECSQCGNTCCIQPIMLSEEERLSGLFEIELKMIRGAKYCVIKSDRICPYLKDDKCSIYENRPMVCRKFPLMHTDVNDLSKLDLFVKYSGCLGFSIGEMKKEDLVPYVNAVRMILEERQYCSYK